METLSETKNVNRNSVFIKFVAMTFIFAISISFIGISAIETTSETRKTPVRIGTSARIVKNGSSITREAPVQVLLADASAVNRK
jgi:hypothetical protein